MKRKQSVNKRKKQKRVSEDDKARRKFARGGRIEAYTFGEALRRK